MLILLPLLLACGDADPTDAAPSQPTAPDAAGPPASPDAAAAKAESLYACTMHPEVRVKTATTCPRCGMDLVLVDPASEDDHTRHMSNVRASLFKLLGEAYDQPVSGVASADLAVGAAIFGANCALCHGPEGKGDGPAGMGQASSLVDAHHATFYPPAARHALITHGVPGTAMAGFKGRLTEQEIVHVYAYVATLAGLDPAAGAAAPAARPGAAGAGTEGAVGPDQTGPDQTGPDQTGHDHAGH